MPLDVPKELLRQLRDQGLVFAVVIALIVSESNVPFTQFVVVLIYLIALSAFVRSRQTMAVKSRRSAALPTHARSRTTGLHGNLTLGRLLAIGSGIVFLILTSILGVRFYVRYLEFPSPLDTQVLFENVTFRPHWAVADSERRHVYISDEAGYLHVIDTDALTETHRVLLTDSGCSTPQGLTFNTARKRVYVTCQGSSGVVVYDTVRNAVVGLIGIPRSRPVAAANDGATVFVVDQAQRAVWSIDTSNNNALSRTPNRHGGSEPLDTGESPIVINAFGTKVYITGNDGMFRSFDLDTGEIKSIRVGRDAWGTVVDVEKRIVYVASPTENTISVLREYRGGFQKIRNLSSFQFPINISLDRSRHLLFVANMYTNDITMIDTLFYNEVVIPSRFFNQSNTIVYQPVGLVPLQKRLFISSKGTGEVVVANMADTFFERLAAKEPNLLRIRN